MCPNMPHMCRYQALEPLGPADMKLSAASVTAALMNGTFNARIQGKHTRACACACLCLRVYNHDQIIRTCVVALFSIHARIDTLFVVRCIRGADRKFEYLKRRGGAG